MVHEIRHYITTCWERIPETRTRRPELLTLEESDKVANRMDELVRAFADVALTKGYSVDSLVMRHIGR